MVGPIRTLILRERQGLINMNLVLAVTQGLHTLVRLSEEASL